MQTFLGAILTLPQSESEKLAGLKEFIKTNKDEIKKTANGEKLVTWVEGSVEGIKAGIEVCLIMQKDRGVDINAAMQTFLESLLKLSDIKSGKLEELKEFIKDKKDEIQQTTEGKKVVAWAEVSEIKTV